LSSPGDEVIKVPDRPECLYHYTSAEGLFGILQNRRIRATDCAFLNEASEIRYSGRELIRRMTDFLAEAEINPSTTGLQSPQQVVMRFALDALTNFVEAEELDNPSYARDSAA
jgi:hypothetical protein